MINNPMEMDALDRQDELQEILQQTGKKTGKATVTKTTPSQNKGTPIKKEDKNTSFKKEKI